MPRSLDIDRIDRQCRAGPRRSGEDYWLARDAAFDAASTLDSLTIDADGTVTVHATEHPGRQLLQRLVAKLVPGI